MTVDHRKQMQEINAKATTEIRRERGKKGAKTRRANIEKRKKMQETLTVLMAMDVNDKNKKQLKEMGIEEEDLNNQTLILVSTMKQAAKGNMRAVEFIAEMLGENGEQKVKVSGGIPVVISGGDDLED